MARLSTYELLNRKRRGLRLEPEAIRELIEGFLANQVADYQMSAFLMAVAIHGLEDDELAALTSAMIESGEQWRLRERFSFIADKHSTGGVGDKVSIVLTPWVASCGVSIAMLSGRGLGHTGGTLDKLDSIPGFQARLTREQLERCVSEIGCAIATSTEGIAPADRRMYALRDVTGTVQSIPLITASIMSKKLAMGASALVLDVKTGSGAFMSSVEDARRLAKSLIAAARGSGTKVEALLTDMDRPLGNAAGNANEVAESIYALQGKGPADLMAVTRAQAVAILVMSGRYDEAAAGAALDEAIASGRALEKTREWIAAQGGDPNVIDNPSRLPQPASILEVKAPQGGFLASIDTAAVGGLCVDLGAGRRRQDDPIDPAAGILFDRNVGDAVTSGMTLARISKGPGSPDDEEILSRFMAAVRIEDDPPAPAPTVIERIVDEEA